MEMPHQTMRKMAQAREYAVAQYVSDHPDDPMVMEYRSCVALLNERRNQKARVVQDAKKQRQAWEETLREMRRAIEHRIDHAILENESEQETLLLKISGEFELEMEKLDKKCESLRKMLASMAECDRLRNGSPKQQSFATV